ncbi:hypothetical protein M422DRAFT_266657 [Sphaerobolus stellatus SS14]|uniref:Unplaced genomic scaffold SPHSTscaffold_164, whole genome shotgun sequence n=1 Tax=Sphaerobolus stellatus (strain SS14) TaxID=990650 RepID=A0A0C9UAR5_SPHS4|nr:hypothetical protein M422DRAFT_266657 [Sphaerobolus stellatus SS14]
MVSTRSKSRRELPLQARKSPSWDCETGPLPLNEDPTESDVVHAESPKSPSPPCLFDSSESINEVQAVGRQSTNAQSPRWLPWQDRFLASEVLKHKPFQEPRRDTQKAWKNLADELRKDSRSVGTEIGRTGSACRARFYKILDGHRKNETRSLQKTGTDEEVDEHVENLTELASLVDSHEEVKTQKTAAGKKRVSAEQQAALDLRKSAMLGVVNRDTLTDVSHLEGATVREKQGQRKRKHASAGPSGLDTEDKENIPVKRPRQSAIERIIEKRQKDDEELLKEVREREDQRQHELLGGLDRLSDSIATLVDLSRAQMQQQNQQQDEERNHGPSTQK